VSVQQHVLVDGEVGLVVPCARKALFFLKMLQALLFIHHQISTPLDV
jgi:hypothetical protein